MNEIEDISLYNERMKKSLLDKLFFIDKIDAKVFLDFGCADGSLIKFLRTLFPDYVYLGYDISEDMIEAAKNNNPDIENNFSSDWGIIESKLAKTNGKNAIILSSIIHEVYAYSTLSDINVFWSRVYNSNFDYIVMRDMVPSRAIDRPSDINDIVKVYREANQTSLSSFEKRWGSVENNKNLVHFLLKYRYTDNWAREVNENYIPITREEVLSNIPAHYKVAFHEHFVLPYLKTIVEKDFNIDIKDNTHLKLILRKQT